MKIIDNIACLKEEIKKLQGSTGLIPTMGALHKGHLSLIEQSIKDNDNSIVSIFVNPIQFGINEDLDKYPRQLKKDCELCEKAGVSIVFAPKVQEIYKSDKNDLTLICPPITVLDKLCAKTRIGHFDGVCSIVAKLFNLTKANRAYFGQKDAQQLFIIKKMVEDLNFDIEIIPCPIVREEDGLALSSRNQYLSKDDRTLALNIQKALKTASGLAKQGINDKKTILDACLIILKDLEVDYVEFVDKNTFDITEDINKNTLLLIAAKTPQSKTRLIDNCLLYQ